MNDATWKRLRILVKIERIATPFAWVVVAIGTVMGLFWALIGQILPALASAVIVATLVAVIRWDPPLVKIEDVEDFK